MESLFKFSTLKSGSMVRSLIVLIATLIITETYGAEPIPSELRGEYTFGTPDQCGYLTIDATGIRTNEDLSCTAFKIKKIGQSLEKLSFQAELLCQVDDPKKVRVKGLFEYAKLRNVWVLAMHLSVDPNDKKRVSLPTLQLFAKCGSQ